jgi:predicted RNA-binding protein with RPS1 domain
MQEQLPIRIFKLVKTDGHMIQLFDSDGTRTVDASEATRFYVKDLSMLINIGEKSVTVNVSPMSDITAIKPLLDSLRQIVTSSYNVTYTLKRFTRTIHPKDFINVVEGFSNWSGTAKQSYKYLGKARIVVKHDKRVDDDIRGSRARNIKSLYIENADGERFTFPPNMVAARAMLMHVKHGGNPYDTFGKKIKSVLTEMVQLSRFKKYAKTHAIFENQDAILEGISTRILELKQMLTWTGSRKRYPDMSADTTEDDPTSFDDGLRSMVEKCFPTECAESMEYILPIIKKINEHSDSVKHVMALCTMQPDVKSDVCDPLHPTNQVKQQSMVAEAQTWIAYAMPYVSSSNRTVLAEAAASIELLPEAYAEFALHSVKRIII